MKLLQCDVPPTSSSSAKNSCLQVRESEKANEGDRKSRNASASLPSNPELIKSRNMRNIAPK